MQISKSLLVVFAAACVIPLAVRGRDTEAQKKAREALEKKMSELGVPAAQPVTQPPPAAPKAPKAPPPPAPAPAPAPVSPAPPAAQPVAAAVPPPPLITAPAADPESIAKARAALRQKLDELNAPAAPSPAPVVPAAPVPPVVPPAAQAPLPPPVVAPPPAALVAPSSDPELIAKAREALHKKIQELDAAETLAVAPAGPAADPAEIAKAREAMRQTLQELPPSLGDEQLTSLEEKPAKSALNFPPLVGPALPISSEKQQRLTVLLQRYKIDLITPEQYQSERAKILGAQ